MTVKQLVAQATKVGLAHAGARAPRSVVRGAALASGYLAVGRWLVDSGFDTTNTVKGRRGVFDAISSVVENEWVLYIEFGVFEGASLRYWSKTLKHPDAELHGFDSFEGLPETFDAHTYGRGHFDRQGRPPEIADSRIHYHVGWFEDTLPKFDPPAHDRLVVTLDADLYSSTALALKSLSEIIVRGTILYFDELSRIDHEPAAFSDFMSTTRRRFEVIALENTFNTGAFLCVE